MNRLSFVRMFLAGALALSLFGMAPAPARADNQIKANTFIVNNSGDAVDFAPGNCDCTSSMYIHICTLRAAIQEANACPSGPHTITFDNDYTISTTAGELPPITANGTILDGSGHNIAIQWINTGGGYRGLEIQASNVLIRGLTISGYHDGIIIASGNNNVIGVVNNSGQRNVIIDTIYGIEVNGGSGNRISGNYIGLDTGGNQHGNQNGVNINSASTVVGTNGDGSYDALEGNIISGNSQYGILVTADSAVIGGNIIGLKADGLTPLGNGLGGILVNAADNALIGADGNNISDAQQRNTISGNTDWGIELNDSHGTRISGNYIGLSSDGATSVANSGYGIWVRTNSYNNTIGVDETNPTYSANERNVIAASAWVGIYLEGYQNTIAGNYIGTDKNGSSAHGNAGGGISISGYQNVIGTDGDGAADGYEGNLISGNSQTGVTIAGSAANTVVAGNSIGLNAAGDTALPNTWYGVKIYGVAGTRIGTNGNGVSDTYERNVISGNLYDGISSANAGSTTISGNYIGTNKLGTAGLGNGYSGVEIDNATQTVTIGIPSGGVAAQGNVISGNGRDGIYLYMSNSGVVAGNSIGVDMNGGSAVPNANYGIRLSQSNSVRIGTNSDGLTDSIEKNQVAGNVFSGVAVWDSDNTVISGNWVGLNYDGDAPIPNQMHGVTVSVTSANTRIGTNGDKLLDEIEGNVISGNTDSGIFLDAQSGTAIAGNVIGLSATHSGGSTAVPNGKGIAINNGGPVLIGTNADGFSDSNERNIISGNTGSGIYITGGDGHIITGNYIGVDWDGVTPLPTGNSGIHIIQGAGTGVRIGTNGDGAYDGAERNIISGNTGYGVVIEANSNSVAGNSIGTDAGGVLAVPNNLGGVWLYMGATNTVGLNSDNSTGEINERNLISGNNGPGVKISGCAQNRVAGNRIGVNAAGTAALPNQGAGVRLDASSAGNTVGSNYDGINDGLEGNLISGNNGSGVQIMGPTSGTTYLYGNLIGLGADRLTPLPNTKEGIVIDYGIGIRIGDTAQAVLANTIGGNGTSGIVVSGTASDVRILSNRIGLSESSTAAGNGSYGVYINTQYAKADALAAAPVINVDTCQASKVCLLYNQIFYNAAAGVLVGGLAGNGYQITSNSFAANGGLGIDLYPDGVTSNDAQDPDSGANGLQNYPVIGSVSFPSDTSLRVSGAFNSTPSTTFTIQLYASYTSDPSGFGEGLDPIYSFSLSTDGSGAAVFDKTFTYLYGNSRSDFTAIATAPDGSTSEFGPTLHLPFEYFYLPAIFR